MTKMEAIGHLCEIKREIESEIAFATERLEKIKDEGIDTSNRRYYEEAIKQKTTWIRAIKMAGTSMTR